MEMTNFPGDKHIYGNLQVDGAITAGALSKFSNLPAGWNDAWVAAKAASVTTPCNVSFFGDSFTQGQDSSDWMNKGWVELVRANILKTYSKYADFYPVTHSQAAITLINPGYTFNGTPPWVYNVTTNLHFNNHGYNRMLYFSSAANQANVMTFTTPYACTSLDIIYMNYATGTFTYNIDGGTNQTVTCNKGGTGSDAVITRLNVTGLANTIHTVNFGNESAVVCMIPLGIVTYASTTSGIGFSRFATCTDQINNYVGTTTWPNEDRISVHQGYIPQNFTNVNNTGFGIPTQPSLAFLCFGLNDCSAGLSITTFQGLLVRFIQAIRRGQSNASIVIVGHSNPDLVNSDVRIGLANPQNWPLYLIAMKQVADAYNCAFVNMHAKWGELGATLGFQTTTFSHPTDAGHADIATAINAII